jgi:hypothetical protein
MGLFQKFTPHFSEDRPHPGVYRCFYDMSHDRHGSRCRNTRRDVTVVKGRVVKEVGVNMMKVHDDERVEGAQALSVCE